MQTDSSIKHVLFDLDNTLWDFSGNSKRILAHIFSELQLAEKGVPDFEAFYAQYMFRNTYLWEQYALGNVTRDEVRHNRFFITFDDFGIQHYALAAQAADYYIHHTRRQTDLLPHTRDVLTYLSAKYRLHIITNGFDEVQFFKLENTGIRSYFETVTTAESAQSLKPNVGIFEYALRAIPASPEHCVYIGDSADADGHGSTKVGMQFIWFNAERKPNTYGFKEVHDLNELLHLL